jgi:hypothetical protein
VQTLFYLPLALAFLLSLLFSGSYLFSGSHFFSDRYLGQGRITRLTANRVEAE